MDNGVIRKLIPRNVDRIETVITGDVLASAGSEENASAAGITMPESVEQGSVAIARPLVIQIDARRPGQRLGDFLVTVVGRLVQRYCPKDRFHGVDIRSSGDQLLHHLEV